MPPVTVLMLIFSIPLLVFVILTLPVRLYDLAGWHRLRKEAFPFRSLKTRRRKAKIALCYLIAFCFGFGTANRWSSPLHDPFWRIRHWWQRLWIRKDEFHPSLNMDVGVMYNMTENEKTEYLNDLVRRRNIAHERDIDD